MGDAGTPEADQKAGVAGTVAGAGAGTETVTVAVAGPGSRLTSHESRVTNHELRANAILPRR